MVSSPKASPLIFMSYIAMIINCLMSSMVLFKRWLFPTGSVPGSESFAVLPRQASLLNHLIHLAAIFSKSNILTNLGAYSIKCKNKYYGCAAWNSVANLIASSLVKSSPISADNE